MRLTQLDSCTLAIVMLDSFKPGALPGKTTMPLARYDTASFTSLWKAARIVESQCLIPRRRPGWEPVGSSGNIGIFLWATHSEINVQMTGLDAEKSPRPALNLVNSSIADITFG